MPYAIYILKCSDNTYYTGLTKNLEGRVQEHQTGAHLVYGTEDHCPSAQRDEHNT